ncbi:MAG: peptidoglycan DD-metalloendopeptidase family protein [Gammaproteobacteria bacterium]|nr:peptidoglycan DD-metalloendopeptidase family protein [Gammaproteobacteria bacterium]MDH4313547.1 peptidoglycan DD-metalloendopeptidase family protein [Gammaproteobacteria bacterium]MDH5212616.1 peptidoglycan DD-metalloendopeptidase family protein [Gammaproteobacteria bacterium]
MAAIGLLLVACGPKTRWDHTPQDEHVVRSGETLFAIAWRYSKDAGELARWNRLDDPSRIYPGQVIRLTPPPGMAASNPAAARRSSPQTPSGRELPPIPTQPSPQWIWPAGGRVAVEFGDRPGTGTGLLIGGRYGQPVQAAAAGRVVYAGDGLIGYGKLIILKHNDTYLSAYGHNASLLVREGETIEKGQRIATMGEGPGREPRLHFEIRQNGKPVNPRQFLPAR